MKQRFTASNFWGLWSALHHNRQNITKNPQPHIGFRVLVTPMVFRETTHEPLIKDKVVLIVYESTNAFLKPGHTEVTVLCLPKIYF